MFFLKIILRFRVHLGKTSSVKLALSRDLFQTVESDLTLVIAFLISLCRKYFFQAALILESGLMVTLLTS